MKEKDVFRLGESYLKKDLLGNWDFYRKYGADGNLKRITYENFESVIVMDGLAKVCKEVAHDRVSVGLYNDKAEVVLPIEWGDIFIFVSEHTNKPAYLFLKDYVGNWGVANLDGSILLSPMDFATAMWRREEEEEYLVLLDKNGKKTEYVVAESGLVEIS